MVMALEFFLVLAFTLFQSAVRGEDLVCSDTIVGNFAKPIRDCMCGLDSHSDVTSVNCTNLNLPLGALSSLPPALKNLTFTGNTLTELPINIFTKDENLLEYIDLSSNHIRTIHGRTFHKVSKVHTLILDHNEWVLENQTRIFSNFDGLLSLSLNNAISTKINAADHIIRVGWILEDSNLDILEEFQLQYNLIPFVKANTFCSLPSLRILHLSNNVIFDSDGLINVHCMSKLEKFYLHNNTLSLLKQQQLDDLDLMVHKNLKVLTLGDNAWRCACPAKPFIRWLQSGYGAHVVADRDTLKCRPEEMGGTRLMDVNVDEILCNSVSEISRSKNGTYVVISLLFATLIILLGGVLWCKRSTIRNKVRKASVPLMARWNSGPDYQGLVSASVI